ncbi:MAG: aldo/keto reductase [Hyphomicrobiales bacterium]|nr:aldo/keto reductase [Hyphomicrobiales bacterium]
MKHVEFPGGEKVPALGLGTWKMGVGDADETAQLRALMVGIGKGMTLIDTAEMYGDGRSEQLVAKAIEGQRDRIFVVSKVLPGNASRKGTIKACENSLKNLNTTFIDLYLLHWRGTYPLAETFAGFEDLKAAGKIRHYGVSNFDVDDLDELAAEVPEAQCAANQVQYNLSDRGIEWDLYPRCQKDGVAMMAYCPLGQGRLINNAGLGAIAQKHGVTNAAIALAFTLRLPGMISIPKSSHEKRVLENAAAADIVLDAEDLAALDKLFPPPRKKRSLAMT